MRDPRKYKSSKWFQLMLEMASQRFNSNDYCPFCVAAVQEAVHRGEDVDDSECVEEPCVFGDSECVEVGEELYKEIFGEE